MKSILLKLDENNKVKEKDYNFIVSNSILSIEGEFTINDVITKVEGLTGESNPKWLQTIKQCLERLNEDGFISALGSFYVVDNWGI